MNLYETLNIKPDSSIKEIRKAYFTLAKKYHPDKSKDSSSREKFEKINYAYNILINDKTRNEYNKMNNINKNKFHKYLEKIFNSNLKIEELKHFGINISDDEFSYLEGQFNDFVSSFNVFDIINLFNKKTLPKKDTSYSNCSDSEVNLWTEDSATYYNLDNLPMYYHKFNKNNIILSLDIDFKNNTRTRKLKIKRKVNDKFITTSFEFNLNHPIIIFREGGDNDDDNNGNLIIKLNLPKSYSWGYNNNTIFYDYSINLYQYIYGVKQDIKINENNIEMLNWIPYRDGNYIETNLTYNNFKIIIRLILDKNIIDQKKDFLKENFS